MKSLLGVLVISAAMIGSGIYLAYRENGNITAPEPQSAATKGAPRPSPIADTLPELPVKIVNAPGQPMSRARTVEEPATSKAELPGTDWAVVAAIYKDYEAADRRARNIAAGSAFRATVHPPKGQGARYMVVLASGLTQGKANQTRERAISGGLPGDTYVTRLRSSSAE
jgi:hypothetical protein